jgi:hypothetical protein
MKEEIRKILMFHGMETIDACECVSDIIKILNKEE